MVGFSTYGENPVEQRMYFVWRDVKISTNWKINFFTKIGRMY